MSHRHRIDSPGAEAKGEDTGFRREVRAAGIKLFLGLRFWLLITKEVRLISNFLLRPLSVNKETKEILLDLIYCLRAFVTQEKSLCCRA